MKLLFSPNGRIKQTEFWKAALILITIGTLASLSILVSFKLSLFFQAITPVIIWCWIAVWSKRYHDSGKSGWMALVPVLTFVIIAIFLSIFITSNFGLGGEERALFEAKIQDASSAGDMNAIIAMSMEYSALEGKKIAIPSAIIMTIFSILFAWVFNNVLIKGEPSKNKYG